MRTDVMVRAYRLWTSVRSHAVQILSLAALWTVFAITTPVFRGSNGVYSVLLGFALLGLITVGVSVTIIAGELDLSAAALAAVSGAIAIRFSELGLAASIFLAVLIGVAFGALQGYFIARMRISSLVITVGTLILLGGVAFIITGGAPLTVPNLSVSDPLLVRWGLLSPDTLIALLVIGAVGLILAYTRFGAEIYAIGGGRGEATAAGVKVARPLTLTFAISGGLAALAGSMAAMKGGSIAPDAFGSLLLQGVSAALIGGISLYGGRGTVWNMIFGVAILSLVSAGLWANGAQDYAIQLATGVILFAVVLFQFVAARRPSSQRGPRKPSISTP